MRQTDLEAIRKLNRPIQDQIDRVYELRQSAILGANGYDLIGGSHGQPVNTIEVKQAQIDEAERKLKRLTDARRKAVKIAVKAIQTTVEDLPQRHILYLRYTAVKDRHCLSWPEVISYVNKYHNIGRSRTYELHHLGLFFLSKHHI